MFVFAFAGPHDWGVRTKRHGVRWDKRSVRSLLGVSFFHSVAPLRTFDGHFGHFDLVDTVPEQVGAITRDDVQAVERRLGQQRLLGSHGPRS